MSIRTSQAFAAFRQAVIQELHNELHNELIPQFNAECADIRKAFEETIEFAKTQPDTPRNKLIDLADRRKRARILDLVHRRKKFLESLDLRMKLEINKRLTEYEAEQFEEVEKHDNGTERPVTKARFPDGSVAKIPNRLHVDFRVFDRV